MKTKIKVIISPSFGQFEPNRAFAKFLKDRGYLDWTSIEARTDQEVIQYVEAQIEKSKLDFHMAFIGIAKDQYVMIAEVETDSPWTISENKGAEFLRFFSYEIIDPQLNYCQEIG